MKRPEDTLRFYIVDPYERGICESTHEVDGSDWIKEIVGSYMLSTVIINDRDDRLLCDEIGMLRTDKKLPLFRLHETKQGDIPTIVAGRAIIVGTNYAMYDDPSEPMVSLEQRVEFIL